MICIDQAGNQLISERIGMKMQGSEILAQIKRFYLRILNHLFQQGQRVFGTAAPNDVFARGVVPFGTHFGFPGCQACISLQVGADAQRFQIPTVFAIVLTGEFSPGLIGFGAFGKTQGDGRFAAHLCRRIRDNGLDQLCQLIGQHLTGQA